MTMEQRLEQVEQQNQKIQRTNKRLTVALTMMAVAMCAVVTMAATGYKDGVFNSVQARTIYVTNDAGDIVVGLGSTNGGNGLVKVYNKTGEGIADMRAGPDGNGVVWAGNRKGKGRTLEPGP